MPVHPPLRKFCLFAPRRRACLLAGWVVFACLGSWRAARAQAPPVVWARVGTGPELNFAQRVAADAAGDVYVAGEFLGAVTLDGVTLTSRGYVDVYLAKYDAAGRLLWLRQAGGAGLDQVWGLAVDAAGNACITGKFALGPSSSNSGPREMLLGAFRLASDSDEVFLAKYDPAGQVLWARQTRRVPGPWPTGGGVGYDSYGSDLALDPAGNVYLTGGLDAPSAFDQVQVGTGGQFLAKYDARGIIQWARTGLGYNGGIQQKVAVDAAGRVYLAGFYAAPLTLAGTTMTPLPTETGAYLAQFNDRGAVQWVHPFAGNYLGCAGLAVDPAGAVLVTNTFRGTVTDDGQPFASLGGTDVLTLKYDPQGRLLWGRQLGGRKDDWPVQSVVDGAGNVYVDVILRGLRTPTTPSGTDDLFNYLVSYAPNGNVRWDRSFPGPYATTLATGQVDEVWVAGSFHFPTQFDNVFLTPGSPSADNSFVARLGAARRPPEAVPFPDAPASMPNVITPNGDGRNDCWVVPGLPAGTRLQVFSRWGRPVFATEDYRQDWSAPGLAGGLYYYYLQSPDRPALRGWLEVIR